jgi:hypothetical protein
VRLFKKGSVTWLNKIHSLPATRGEGIDLKIKEESAIVHHHYSSISQFIIRMDRYTSIQAKEKIEEGYQFKTSDLFKKPLSEFLSRFLAGEGYRDGLHGFVVSVLQTFSEFVLYFKLWEEQKFKEEKIPLSLFESEYLQASSEINHWIKEQKIKDEKNKLKKIVQKVIS